RRMTDAEVAQAISKAYANSNAIFFVFFPDRRRGVRTIEDDNTIVFKPEGGIDWKVVLDPDASLPKSMVHQEAGRTINATFASYEPVEGLQLEKEIHRSNGDPRFDAVIRFTKTVVNPTVDASLFAMQAR